MAWVHGNTPTTQDLEQGRILCEAMYAINEREAIMNETETEWPESVGSYPGIAALSGVDILVDGRQFITGMRTAVDNLLTNTHGSYDAGSGLWFWKAWFVDASYVQYTKASLLTAAIGQADWTACPGGGVSDIEDVTWISEILKAVETMSRVRMLHYVTYPTGGGTIGQFKEIYKHWEVAPGVGVPGKATAYANCEAESTAIRWVTNLVYQHHAYSIGGLYYIWGKWQKLGRYDISTIPAGVSLVRALLPYYSQVTPAPYDGTAASGGAVDVYQVPESEYTTPTWAPHAGGGYTKLLTEDVLSRTNPDYEEVDISSGLDLDPTYLYLKCAHEDAVPGDAHEGTKIRNGMRWGDRSGIDYDADLTFDPAFTYN